MTKLRSIAFAAALAGGLAAAPPVAAQAGKHAPFMIGVFALDGGVLMPLASFDGSTWKAPWPAYGDALPGSAREIPASWWPGFSATGWRAALSSGDHPLRIVAPMRITTGCGQDRVGLTTDYPQDTASKDGDEGARIAATGSVTIRYIRTEGEYDDKTDVWRTGERLLLDALARRKATLSNIVTTNVARIPLQDGGVLWSIEAVGQRRHAHAWISQSKSVPFELVDDQVAQDGQEGAGMLTPIGAIWGLDRVAILAWRQGLDSVGGYVVVGVDAKGANTLISAGAAGC